MVSTIISIARIVLLGLWVGAMTGFAFLFAPIAFTHIGPTPAFASMIAACVRSISAAGFAFGLTSILLTLVLAGESRRAKLFISGSIVLALLFTAIETMLIVPKMETTPLQTAAYESLHHQSSGVYSAVMLFALIGLVAAARKPVAR